MPRIVHFDIRTDDPERAIAFYKKAFGWSIVKWSGGPMDYWLVTTGPEGEPGINGGLSRRMEPGKCEHSHGYNCTVGVDSIDDAVEKVKAAGGTITMQKTPLPGVGWFAACVDTEGNGFALMQADPKAGM
jgi:predicted enzyme related to lactoylglutathione lyase